MKKPIITFLLLWFLLVFAAAYSGVFIKEIGGLPGPVGLAFAVPLLGFLLVFTSSVRFRHYVSEIPTVLLVALHGWRFIGMGFIMAYYRGLLPPGFAWPAGLGDIAVALGAPYIAWRVSRDFRYIETSSFRAWNVLGIIDFLVAVGSGVAHQAAPQFFNASVGSGLMQELPFALIPCFFVPLLGISHIIMLHQARSSTSSRAGTFKAEFSRSG